MTKAKLSLSRETKRLSIRPMKARDFEEWRHAYSSMRELQNEWDETNWETVYLNPTEFRKILQKQNRNARAGKSHIFGVFRKDDGALLGIVGLNDISRGIFQNAYLGYRIFNMHWGYGYAKEAVKAALDIGFRDLHLHRIEAGIQAKNTRSIAVARALKMRHEGLSRRRLFYHGKWVDLEIYVLTSEDLRIKYEFPENAAD